MEIHHSGPSAPDVPDDLTLVQFIFDSTHSVRPKKREGTPWLIDDATGRSLGEPELRERSFALANGLRYKYGIGEDDVVLLFSRNHVDYPVAIWAVHRLGGVISGANPDFSTKELPYILEATKATLIIAHPDCLSTAEVAAREHGLSPERIIIFNTTSKPPSQTISVEDIVRLGRSHGSAFQERKLKPGEAKTKLAFISFSSGTTGRPKAIAVSHYSPIFNIIQMAVHNRVHEDYCAWEDQRFRPGDVAIGVIPFSHLYSVVINMHLLMFCGMSLVVIPKFNFIEMLNSIVRHKITHLFLVPQMVVLLCKHPAVKNYKLHDYVRMIMCGAATLSHDLLQQLYELLPNAHIGQTYGMTELCTIQVVWPIDRKRGTPGSAGRLLPGTIAKVVKPDGSTAGYDEPGELVIYSPSNSLGYPNDPQASKETFIDGWIRTGDEVRIDKNGDVRILDRQKEIMEVNGFKVIPAELEACILEHHDVANACVVGVPDEQDGEVPMAFVVLTAEASKLVAQDLKQASIIKASIAAHVADKKLAHKQLAGGIEFVDGNTVSPVGRLLRRLHRDRAKELRSRRN